MRTLAGYVGSPQPHWWRHAVTITEGTFDGLREVLLHPMYGSWRGKVAWVDADGEDHLDPLTHLVTWTEPCSADPMGVRLYCTAVLAD